MSTPALRTIATYRTAGPFLTATGPTSYVLNHAMLAAEANLPEGARVQLLLPRLDPATAQAMVDYVQTAFLQGRLRDPATGRAIVPWPDTPGVIADVPVGTPDTVRLRWIKGQWQIAVIIALVVTGLITIVVLLNELHQSPWTLQAATPTPTGIPAFGGSPFRIFWVPWYDALPIAAGLAVAPVILHQIARTEAGVAETVQEQRTLAALKERR